MARFYRPAILPFTFSTALAICSSRDRMSASDTCAISGRGAIVDGSAGRFVQWFPVGLFVVTRYILIHSAFG